jgi:histone deacetylase complex regulatory component SIN3
MYTDDSLSEDMVRGFTDEDIEKRRRINAHLIKTFRGFKKLGLTDEQIYNQALNRGYGKRRMALLLNGLMERPALQTPFIKNMATKGDVHIERLRTYQNQLESYGRYIPVE